MSAADSSESDRYGRYQIVRKLATGGMGEVYLAKSIGAAGFQKRVVIKRLLPHLVQHAHFVEGLVREAKLLVMLDHPNIVQVLDLGREGDDYFMAMEFVHGYNLATIAHYCSQQRVIIPAPACGYVALEVLAGLEYAHGLVGPDGTRHNIIHRDVSPQNVLISRAGRVKLADFGIAKVLNEAEAEVTTSLKGKFRYMAPEALDGGRIDHRYDLFAVGILLFESLCRRHLFAGQRDVDILNQVRQARVPPIARYHPGVPAALVAVTERALSRDPEARFPDAAQFAAALRAAVPVADNEAGRTLRLFVEDIYERVDFPLNKPKLPDLDAVDLDVTRSVMLASRLLPGQSGRHSGRQSGRQDVHTSTPSSQVGLPRPGGGAMTLLWAGFLLISMAVAYLAYALLLRDPKPAVVKDPVIIQVEKTGRDGAGGAMGTEPDAALDDGHQSSARPEAAGGDAGSERRPGHRPGQRRLPAITFTEQVGQASFSKAGPRLQQCFDRNSGDNPGEITLGVTSIIDGDGRVTRVTLSPPAQAATPLGGCVKRVAQHIRYPRHDKPTVTFYQPLRIKRR